MASPMRSQFLLRTAERILRLRSRNAIRYYSLSAPKAERTTVHALQKLKNSGPLYKSEIFDTAIDANGGEKAPNSAIRDASVKMLRDSCACSQCVDPSTKQKQFQTADIPTRLAVRDYSVTNDEQGGLVHQIRWKNDILGYDAEHVTHLKDSWINEAMQLWPGEVANEASSHNKVPEKQLWNAEVIKRENKWLDYKDFINADQTTLEGLKHLYSYGLLFLRNMPDDETAIERVTDRMGGLKDTFYGRTWNVKSVPNAKNVAYTHQFLGLHMDLLYTTNPPHLQLLHSLRARAPGGASMFSDAFNAAYTMWNGGEASRRLFNILCYYPVTYHYRNDSQHYHYTRSTIELDTGVDGRTDHPVFRAINWSPPFQAPFQPLQNRIPFKNKKNRATFDEYVEAAKRFNELVEHPDNMYEYRLEEGDCVIFDNRRTLHARREFDATKGDRWLKGAYVDDDVYYSRMRVLQEQIEGQWMAEGTMRQHT